jgi:predicted N-formylglutamate amidohydrolase
VSTGSYGPKGWSGDGSGKILEPDESPSVSFTEGRNKDWLVVCDHASNRLPRALKSLGIPRQYLDLHIAWDIGAALVATRLASRLGAPLVASGYSRLVIDCNRYPSAQDSVPAVSDHHKITANAEIDEEGRRQRQIEFFLPYHRAIDSALRDAENRGNTPAFISIHSCAPSMNGRHRPWHIGIAWLHDQRMSSPLLEHLSRLRNITVGDNQPYDLVVGDDFTTPEHAMRRGLAHLQIEFRQDLLATPQAAESWADLLFDALMAVESRDSWHRQEQYLTPADRVLGIDQWL